MAAHRILVVEDSPTMRQLLSFALRRLRDVEILEAQDGVDGLRKLTSGEFDLALIDINMPGMDGLKLIGLVRNDARLSDLPIIVITSRGSQADRERAVALGANAYLTKPIETHEVLAMARSLLKIP